MNDRIFYYTLDKKIFQNKIDALEYANKTKQEVHFYYYDDVYSKVNWTIEPPGNLSFYYKEQAQRIRDQYDYVVLFYSGGYDSTNILETFYYNNILIDKIVCVGAFKQDSRSGVDENHNGEIYHNCFPTISRLGLEKITQLCDYSEYFHNPKSFDVYEYGDEWIYNVGPWYSPHNWFWKDIHKYVIPKNMENKKVALVWGKDKANLKNINGKFGFQFTDVAALSYGNRTTTKNIDSISFYWDPHNPILLIKQIHEMKNLYLRKYTNTHIFTEPNPNDVYDLKNKIMFKSPKSATNILSLRDNFLISNTNSDIFNFYKMGIQKINDRINVNTDLITVRSRFYTIDQ